MDLVQKKIKVSDDADEADASSEAAANVSESTDVGLDSHPLLGHLRLYIFSDVYLGSELKQLAYERVAARFVGISRPQTLDQQNVRSSLSCGSPPSRFSPATVSWTGWPIMRHTLSINFQVQPSFHELLEAAPALCSRMMNTLRPAAAAPWQSQSPKHRFPPYKPGSYMENVSVLQGG
jgi:hypothetical protein